MSEAAALESNATEAGTGGGDAELRAIWEKNHSEAELLKSPPMPDVPAGEDIFKATHDWMQLPLKDRRMAAAVHRDVSDLKKQGEALGMKTETAADLKAVQDMIAARQKEQSPAIDKDTQASLDTFKTIVPHAKDHKEASKYLNEWAQHIERNPVKGWRDLIEAQGVNVRDLITQEEAAEMLLGNFRPEPSGQTGKRNNSHAGIMADMEADLRATATDIYRE
jgi:hypothetical protein